VIGDFQDGFEEENTLLGYDIILPPSYFEDVGKNP